MGPVDEVHVDLVNAEPSEALLGCGNRVVAPSRIELAPWIELGGKKYLAARHAAVAQRPSDALLVVVGLGRVNIAIPQVERPAYGTFTHAAPLGICQTPKPSMGIRFPSARTRARPSPYHFWLIFCAGSPA